MLEDILKLIFLQKAEEFYSGTYFDEEKQILFWNPRDLKENIFEVVGVTISLLKPRDTIFPLRSIDQKYEWMCVFVYDQIPIEKYINKYNKLIENVNLINKHFKNKYKVKMKDTYFLIYDQKTREPVVLITDRVKYTSEMKLSEIRSLLKQISFE